MSLLIILLKNIIKVKLSFIEEYLKRNEAGNKEERVPEFPEAEEADEQPDNYTERHEDSTSHNLKKEEGKEEGCYRDDRKKENESLDIFRLVCVAKPAQNA